MAQIQSQKRIQNPVTKRHTVTSPLASAARVRGWLENQGKNLMGELDKLELTTNELLERGWTKTLIKRFLPRPDGCRRVDHWKNYSGQNTYASVKIWNIEQSEKFALAFRRTWNGRNKGRMKGTLPEAVLKKMRREHHPKIPKRTREEIRRDTLWCEVVGLLNDARIPPSRRN